MNDTISVLELSNQDVLLDIAALLGGADDVDGIRIYEAGVVDGDLRVVLADTDENGRAVYLRVVQ